MRIIKGLIATGVFALSLQYSSLAQAEVNLRFSPIGALIGLVNAQLDIPISEAWTLGPEVAYWGISVGDIDVDAFAVGVRANYYFSGSVFTDSWYFGPSVSYGSFNLKEENTANGTLEAETSGMAISALFGYQWMWETFNINLGIGFSQYQGNDIELKDSTGVVRDDSDNVAYNGGALEFTMGFRF